MVNQLKRKGFDFIVLTRYTYRTGFLDDPMPSSLSEAKESRDEDVIRWTRLHDCRAVLSASVKSVSEQST